VTKSKSADLLVAIAFLSMFIVIALWLVL